MNQNILYYHSLNLLLWWRWIIVLKLQAIKEEKLTSKSERQLKLERLPPFFEDSETFFFFFLLDESVCWVCFLKLISHCSSPLEFSSAFSKSSWKIAILQHFPHSICSVESISFAVWYFFTPEGVYFAWPRAPPSLQISRNDSQFRVKFEGGLGYVVRGVCVYTVL